MKLPDELENLIENEVQKYKLSNLKILAQNLSDKYMKNSGTYEKLLTKEEEAVCYSVIRMPATFCAISTVLENILENNNIEINSLLDVGAGTGAGTWAAKEYFSLDSITCLEREKAMQTLGKKYINDSKVRWIDSDIINDEINGEFDLVIVSYMINELPKVERQKVLEKLLKCTKKILIIIEPGTPLGFKNIKEIRNYIIDKNLNILAPCTHKEKCELEENDWCSSICRVQRTKVHKLLKEGTIPYEDEKFSYIVCSKENFKVPSARILRHPIIQSKMIKLKLCTSSGIKEIILTKKNGKIYKEAKKKKAGDAIEI